MLEEGAREHNRTLNGEAKFLVEAGLIITQQVGTRDVTAIHALQQALPHLRRLIEVMDKAQPRKKKSQ